MASCESSFIIVLYRNVSPLLLMLVPTPHGSHLSVLSFYWTAQREPGMEESNTASHKISEDEFELVTSW